MKSIGQTIQSEKITVYLIMVVPAIVIYLAVMAFPTIYSLFLGFTDYNVYKNTFVFKGLKHFKIMFTDSLFWHSLKNNIYIVLISVFGQIPLGFGLAYIVCRRLVKFRNFFQIVIYLPTVISPIVIGILWSSFFSPYGAFTGLMKMLTGPEYSNTLFTDPNTAMFPVLFVMLWYYTGFYFLIFLANMQKIDDSIIEAARVDGANNFQIVVRVVLPMLSGVIVTASILAISGSLRSFDLLYAMTLGGPSNYTSVIGIYLYNKSFRLYNYSLGGAISAFIIMASFILIGVVKFAEKQFGAKEE